MADDSVLARVMAPDKMKEYGGTKFAEWKLQHKGARDLTSGMNDVMRDIMTNIMGDVTRDAMSDGECIVSDRECIVL